MSILKDKLNKEIERRKVQGAERVTLAELENRLKALGYRIDRAMDCFCMSRYMTGVDAGESYPCISTGLKEIDTGKSFANFEARRDDNFIKLQEMRFSGIYCIVKNSIFQI